jgi:hypothetical protein
VWLEGSLGLVILYPEVGLDRPTTVHSDKDQQAPPRGGLKFGGREHTLSGFGDLSVVLQHGADALGG